MRHLKASQARGVRGREAGRRRALCLGFGGLGGLPSGKAGRPRFCGYCAWGVPVASSPHLLVRVLSSESLERRFQVPGGVLLSFI